MKKHYLQLCFWVTCASFIWAASVNASINRTHTLSADGLFVAVGEILPRSKVSSTGGGFYGGCKKIVFQLMGGGPVGGQITFNVGQKAGQSLPFRLGPVKK